MTSCITKTEIIYKDRICEILTFDDVTKEDLYLTPDSILRKTKFYQTKCLK